MNAAMPNGEHLTTNAVWNGDGSNQNATLTVFRHFDTATVVKGLVGRPPQTAWITDYGLLERIHYLLVAGFDVYSNLGHQMNSRLYMDFLRMEGEFNFLALLPPKTRISELQQWYHGVSKNQRKHLLEPHKLFLQPSSIVYKTDQPKQELYQLLQRKLTTVLPDEHSLHRDDIPPKQRQALDKLHRIEGWPAMLLPQVTFLTVTGADVTRQYTVLHNNAHNNITSMLHEDSHRVPEKDTLTVVNGFLGAYPGAFVRVDEAQLDNYVESILVLRDDTGYKKLMDRFGIRRTNPDFWKHSDQVNASYKASHPYTGGLLDYNRLENR